MKKLVDENLQQRFCGGIGRLSEGRAGAFLFRRRYQSEPHRGRAFSSPCAARFACNATPAAPIPESNQQNTCWAALFIMFTTKKIVRSHHDIETRQYNRAVNIPLFRRKRIHVVLIEIDQAASVIVDEVWCYCHDHFDVITKVSPNPSFRQLQLWNGRRGGQRWQIVHDTA